MTEHELGQMQDYEDKCAEDEPYAGGTTLPGGGIACVSFVSEEYKRLKETKYEIAKQLWFKYNLEVYQREENCYPISFPNWLDKQEAEERDQRISDYTGG